MSLVARCTAKSRVVSRENWLSSLFHSSASLEAKTKRPMDKEANLSSPSGSKPKSKRTSTPEPEPRPSFERDVVPHTDREEANPKSSLGRDMSFRRRSAARNERDWGQRSGKWRESSFGGGSAHGSQMGLREDRPKFFGMRAPSQWRPFGAPSTEARYDRRPSFGPQGEDDRLPSTEARYERPPRRPMFGLQAEDQPYRPPWGKPAPFRRRPASFARDGGSSLRQSASPSEPSQDTMEIEANSELASRTLKNRNQNPTPPPPSQSPKSDSDERSDPNAPPPRQPKKQITLFDKPNVYLARAGIPIITKADPVSGSTTSEYSPAMHQKNMLPTKFTSPPLLPGLLECLTDVLGGPFTPPTPIQALSLKWVLDSWTSGAENQPNEGTALSTDVQEDTYKEFLLASETGSGKSIAYLLPVIQALKITEARRLASGASPTANGGLSPRALILAPTHELARQLAASAKALLHKARLRVVCASRANAPTRPAKGEVAPTKGNSRSARRMKEFLSTVDDGVTGEFEVTAAGVGGKAFPVDVVVGTPMKLMEMVRGRGWEKGVEFGGGPAAAFEREQSGVVDNGDESKEKGPRRRRGRDTMSGSGEWSAGPEMDLSQVEWVVVDEADVLFDSDFQETTRLLLADISKARGHEVPFVSLPVGLLASTPPTESIPLNAANKSIAKHQKSSIVPHNYPFNFIVTSATIPRWLSSYFNAYHPALHRLISPNLHHLPKTLQTEYVSWTGGSKNADIERRLRKVWAADAADGLGPVPGSLGDMSKVIIFCNKNTKVEDLGVFLEEKGIKNVQLSGTSPNRQRGNNKHLDGFLRPTGRQSAEEPASESSKPPPVKNDPMNVPHVMITTSLLSRGLDFSPNIKYVFIVDEPRNMIDFLHRAGRTGRAGASGRVVIFGKTKGRGSERSKGVRQRIKALAA
ncbi:P-loop containing nucleoside triphosphate hydrolase protein [Favolaschia claudopus]|uniref:RNA helicase n=1 Tax=Favolaschia claudopus TaxID=2862362 RepID=A0AAW0DP77_9AGAR